MPTARDATDTAKPTLGWPGDTNPQYNLWLRKVRTHVGNNGIFLREDVTKMAWQLLGTYAKKTSIGFPSSGAGLLCGNSNAATEAKAHCNYLLLDVLKKGREQARKAGPPADSSELHNRMRGA